MIPDIAKRRSERSVSFQGRPGHPRCVSLHPGAFGGAGGPRHGMAGARPCRRVPRRPAGPTPPDVSYPGSSPVVSVRLVRRVPLLLDDRPRPGRNPPDRTGSPLGETGRSLSQRRIQNHADGPDRPRLPTAGGRYRSCHSPIRNGLQHIPIFFSCHPPDLC